jgi:hypothetical protein
MTDSHGYHLGRKTSECSQILQDTVTVGSGTIIEYSIPKIRSSSGDLQSGRGTLSPLLQIV